MRNLRSVIARFGAACEAVAAVEFALVLPIMLVLYIGSVEASTMISMDRRVQAVTGSLGDLVARSNATISTATLKNYFRAAEGIMVPYSSANLVQVVTSVYVKSDGTTTVIWSRQYKDGVLGSSGKAHTVGQPLTLPTAMTNITLNRYVIVSETYSSFVPKFNLVYDAAVPLYRENFYVPRFGTEIVLGS